MLYKKRLIKPKSTEVRIKFGRAFQYIGEDGKMIKRWCFYMIEKYAV